MSFASQEVSMSMASAFTLAMRSSSIAGEVKKDRAGNVFLKLDGATRENLFNNFSTQAQEVLSDKYFAPEKVSVFLFTLPRSKADQDAEPLPPFLRFSSLKIETIEKAFNGRTKCWQARITLGNPSYNFRLPAEAVTLTLAEKRPPESLEHYVQKTKKVERLKTLLETLPETLLTSATMHAAAMRHHALNLLDDAGISEEEAAARAAEKAHWLAILQIFPQRNIMPSYRTMLLAPFFADAYKQHQERIDRLFTSSGSSINLQKTFQTNTDAEALEVLKGVPSTLLTPDHLKLAMEYQHRHCAYHIFLAGVVPYKKTLQTEDIDPSFRDLLEEAFQQDEKRKRARDKTRAIEGVLAEDDPVKALEVLKEHPSEDLLFSHLEIARSKGWKLVDAYLENQGVEASHGPLRQTSRPIGVPAPSYARFPLAKSAPSLQTQPLEEDLPPNTPCDQHSYRSEYDLFQMSYVPPTGTSGLAAALAASSSAAPTTHASSSSTALTIGRETLSPEESDSRPSSLSQMLKPGSTSSQSFGRSNKPTSPMQQMAQQSRGRPLAISSQSMPRVTGSFMARFAQERGLKGKSGNASDSDSD